MYKEVQDLLRFQFQFRNDNKTVCQVLASQCDVEVPDLDLTNLNSSSKIVSTDSILPSFNIVVGSVKHGAHCWHLHLLGPSRDREWLKAYTFALRNIRLRAVEIKKPRGFCNNHSSSEHRAGEDLRNVVWYDPANSMFLSFNRSAIFSLGSALGVRR